MSKNVLIVAAHPDDEVLGCGATIARHVAEGDAAHVIFMADGTGSRAGVGAPEREKREIAKAHALKALGVAWSHSFNLQDNLMDKFPLLEIVQPLEALIDEIRPHTVYTHHPGDLNVDHRLTCQAVMTACRPTPGRPLKEILAFEVVSSTEWAGPLQPAFQPNVFVEITHYWPKKLEALRAYALEMRPPPHSRSIDHLDVLSRHRGACVGMERAEGFELIRRLW